MIRKTISHYKILGKLGEGERGVVSIELKTLSWVGQAHR